MEDAVGGDPVSGLAAPSLPPGFGLDTTWNAASGAAPVSTTWPAKAGQAASHTAKTKCFIGVAFLLTKDCTVGEALARILSRNFPPLCGFSQLPYNPA